MAKTHYRVRNWPEYNRALVNRYRLEVWLSEGVAQGWYAQPGGGRGRPLVYSDLALTCLTIRALLDLPLRGCQGLLESVLTRLGLAVPDYTVMCRRARTLKVRLPVRRRPGETVHLVVDSSGLKVYGEGEWKVRAHGWSKRRTWRKLHLGPGRGDGFRIPGFRGHDTAIAFDTAAGIPRGIPRRDSADMIPQSRLTPRGGGASVPVCLCSAASSSRGCHTT